MSKPPEPAWPADAATRTAGRVPPPGAGELWPEARERHTLAHEIRNLQQLNAQMAQEALNLTKALKGDNKTQGNWGEVVLTRVLEASGLREGYEYQTQVSIETDNRSRMQPDVIVRLPQGKDVVIDAK